jgi:hypothetical protein
MAIASKPEAVKAAEPSRITYVQFRDPVSVGVGEFAAIEFWSALKHSKTIECTERGNWIVLAWVDAKGQRGRIRVPMTNIAGIREAENGET